jgi:hypothetical protein
MPVTEHVQEAVESVKSGNRNTALAAAAAAAATGAATFAARKALSHDGGTSSLSPKSGRSGASSILASAASSSWDAAADVLIPMAEDAAGAAGKYLAEHGPEVIRERIVPSFIEAFNDAK